MQGTTRWSCILCGHNRASAILQSHLYRCRRTSHPPEGKGQGTHPPLAPPQSPQLPLCQFLGTFIPPPPRGTATRPQTAMPAAALKPGEQTEEPRGTTCTPASEQQLTVSLVESLTRDRTSVPLCACGPRCGSVHTHLPALRDSTRA